MGAFGCRVGVVVVALAAVVVVGGCGGGGDAAGAAGGAADKRQIEATYAAFVKGFYSSDPKATCAAMTPRAQRQFGAVGASGKPRSCEAQARGIDPSDFSEHRPFVVSVKVDGDRAIARVKTKTSETYNMLFVKTRDGEWKIARG